MPIHIELAREKETKRTVRFTETGSQEHVGTIYVPKRTLAALGDPDRLELTLASAAPAALQAA